MGSSFTAASLQLYAAYMHVMYTVATSKDAAQFRMRIAFHTVYVASHYGCLLCTLAAPPAVTMPTEGALLTSSVMHATDPLSRCTIPRKAIPL
jgi:hypothetical protein